MKKAALIIFVIFAVFVMGLMMGRGNKTTAYQPKASTSVQAVSTGTSAVQPNLIGVVTSIQAVNNGNYAIIVNGINQPDFVVNSANQTPLKAKNYLVIVTPKTILVKVSTGKVLTIKELQKNAQVAIATGSDLSTALEIAVK